MRSLIPAKKVRILNSKGEPIVLNEHEKYACEVMQRQFNERQKMFTNSLGYEVSITTLTTVMKKITEQKFFELPPADYLPVRVGEGAWSSNLTTYRSFDVADDFETGIINTGGQTARQASADAGVDALNIPVFNWSKAIGWSIFDLELAARSGNWDVVAQKEKARKRNWDLGVQRIAFLGMRGQNGVGGNCVGLLNQAGITTNSSVITKPISLMTPDELSAFLAALVDSYRSNVQRSAWPTHFTIPESDYLGMANQSSAAFPMKTKLELVEDALKLQCRNKGFKVLPCAYGDAAYHADVTQISGKQIYALYNYNEESLRMDVPVDYTSTLANSLDNFNFQNAGYGQVTGALAYRPLELMYYTF